ncbi:uncharacterized protein BKA55DRAFT_498857 [Fusarium redolens]|uniref:F-box domain-containing protein n=1 Tax=Fusarium redolens TaxID=48865 RepID=A0A9P9R9N7_FUSRE|nr:uncharacterized protein BKA55DRAFT_498857 [Fusarium redolens]KAH7270774.1 hypothetical protein BKA55DRAFT_498857 [Fusarium redolens]
MAQNQNLLHRWICGSGSQVSKTKNNSDSLLLNLPVDILLIINSFLPASSQLCLLTTCHGIKRLLEHTTVPFSQLTLKQKRAYKTFVVRQFPNAWLSGRRLTFREFQAKDLCPQPKGPPYENQPGWDRVTLRCFERGALLIRHRHIQMSLKYDRLEKKTRQQKSFLKTLLKPYHTDFSAGLEMHPLDKFGAVGHFESHPKLVSGRYLLFNQWTYTNPWKDGTIVLKELGRFGACKHQRMTETGWGEFVMRQRWRQNFRWFGIADGFSEPFFLCVDEAFNNPGCQVDGMCPYCLTEFSICATTKMMQMRVWRDLGIEDARWTPVWRTQLGGIDLDGLPRGDDCLEIRSRYGDTGVEGH